MINFFTKLYFRLKYYNSLGVLQQGFAIFNALYGCVSIYRVSYFVSACFISTAFHQTFAPELSDAELEDLLKVQEKNTIKESLIDGEVLIDEDDMVTGLHDRPEMGN